MKRIKGRRGQLEMDRVEIVRFTSKDLPFGKMLTDGEGWHRSMADWERLLRIEPLGMVKARSGSKDVGIAGTINYDKVAWIHSVIVREEYRGKGIGKALMHACIDYAKDHGSPHLKLDSVRGFEGFYKGLGFVEEFESLRFLKNGEPMPPSAEGIRPSDIEAIVSFDKAVTGLDRSRVLKEVYVDSPELAFCVKAGEEISGYVLARRGEERVQIGPCVATRGDTRCARRLISSVIGSSPGSRFRMCVPGYNVSAVALASELGFESAVSSTRMYLGKRFQESELTFAMISPEKG